MVSNPTAQQDSFRHGNGVFGRTKLSIAMFALGAALTLAGCGNGEDETSGGNASAPVASEAVVVSEPAPAAETPETPAPAANEPAAAEPAPAVEAPAAVAAESEGPAESATPAPVSEAASTPPSAADAGPSQSPPGLPPLVTEEPTLDPDMLAMIEAGDPIAGRTYAARCASCHALDRGGNAPGAAQIGPVLYGIFDAPIGAVAGFDYSPAFQALGETGATWTAARLNAFLTDPEGAVPGTEMTIGAIPSDQERANVIAFLRILADEPQPLVGDGEPAQAMGDTELLARIAAADPDRGQALTARCSGCHRFGAGDEPLIGPTLYDIVGAPVGGKEGFRYSAAFQDLNAAGAIWTYERLDEFLANPAVAIPGTAMGFTGVGGANDRAAIIAYLRTLAEEPFPLVVEGPTEIGVVRPGLDPLTYTADQADAGADAYADQCSECHGQDLHGEVIDAREEGVDIVPPLIGPNFETSWFTGNVGALFHYLLTRMPPDDPGGLDDAVYAEILAYVMARNGFAPGTKELPTDQTAMANMGFFQQ
jgi:cytochrome c